MTSKLSKTMNMEIFEIFPWIQALGFVFHNAVEKPVDNNVDNPSKCLIDGILHQIA